MASLKVMSTLSPDCILPLPFELVIETTTGEAASVGTVAAKVERLPAVSPTPPDIALRLMAVIARRAGVRVPACMMPVPRRMREVRAAMKARGVAASCPHASADHRPSTPSRSASTT